MSQIRELVYERRKAEGDEAQPVGRDRELRVPWQVCTLAGRELTVHWRTNAMNVFVRLDLVEEPDQVGVAVLERHTSDNLPGCTRSETVTLSAPLADRTVVDDTTGRVREIFQPDLELAWRTFDVAVAQWLLAGDELSVLQGAAASALFDGCESPSLQKVAAGAEDVGPVYAERGLSVPDLRAAAKLVVDAALDEAAADDAYAESIWFVLDRVAASNKMDADVQAQLAELLALGEDIQTSLEATGDSTVTSETFLVAARALRARGGLAI